MVDQVVAEPLLELLSLGELALLRALAFFRRLDSGIDLLLKS